MSDETKRDVFTDAVDALADAQASGGNVGHQDANLFMAEYDTALSDDLPVIPKAVGDVIVKLKHKKFSLSGAMSYAAVVSLSPWMTFEHEDTFALAWVLGVWRVEETGEIVKLEAEK
ncbi:DUF1642 domain-containing protein [Lacticaseibacillus paracasei]|uniref:DUF1642 domain-containing protein n=1 Tax=Lacticaseibacillus paracasei TaxID=1597 RepID=UPI0011575013|nr:DUF1642 domain-containing protein [Lacticaseibacillus paracasei]VTZ82312.1 hypothetical protein LPCP272_00237 [Lacticaseibacillus paracasei]